MNNKLEQFLSTLNEEEKLQLNNLISPERSRKRASISRDNSPFIEQVSPSISFNNEDRESISLIIDPFKNPDTMTLIKSYEVALGRLIKDKLIASSALKKLKEEFINKDRTPKSIRQNIKVSYPKTKSSETFERRIKELNMLVEKNVLNILVESRTEQLKEIEDEIKTTKEKGINRLKLILSNVFLVNESSPLIKDKILTITKRFDNFIQEKVETDRLEKVLSNLDSEDKKEVRNAVENKMSDIPMSEQITSIIRREIRPLEEKLKTFSKELNIIKSQTPSTDKISKNNFPRKNPRNHPPKNSPKNSKISINEKSNVKQQDGVKQPSGISQSGKNTKNLFGQKKKWKDRQKRNVMKDGRQ